MVRKICGKGVASTVSHLEKNGQTVTEFKDIANTLGQSFAQNSSEHYTPKFWQFKITAKTKHLNFKSKNLEKYNKRFSLKELVTALQKSHNTCENLGHGS